MATPLALLLVLIVEPLQLESKGFRGRRIMIAHLQIKRIQGPFDAGVVSETGRTSPARYFTVIAAETS